jgi:hypothetical protein
MGWEQRGQRTYFYRSVRIDGQPRKEYLGHGPVGELHAQLVSRGLRLREAGRRAWRDERARLAVADAALADVRTLASLIFGANMLLAGFHDHRGEWRRRHEAENQDRQGRTRPGR